MPGPTVFLLVSLSPSQMEVLAGSADEQYAAEAPAEAQEAVDAVDASNFEVRAQGLAHRST